MVNKADSMQTVIKAQLRGGNGDAELTHLFDAQDIAGKAKMCARIVLQPGCSIGEHTHDDDGEMYIILSGKGMVNDNGTPKEMQAGDAMWTTNGEAHSIINHGNEPLVMLAIVIC